MAEQASNYNSAATINLVSLCEYNVGCPDSTAVNFNGRWKTDDGSCMYR